MRAAFKPIGYPLERAAAIWEQFVKDGRGIVAARVVTRILAEVRADPKLQHLDPLQVQLQVMVPANGELFGRSNCRAPSSSVENNVVGLMVADVFKWAAGGRQALEDLRPHQRVDAERRNGLPEGGGGRE